jgi:uncharacterized OB-fold protein
VQLQQCVPCGAWVFYPRALCPRCLAPELTWKRVSGEGEVYTFTRTRTPTSPEFDDATPQLMAVIQLVEGVRLNSVLVDVDPDAIMVGMKVRPVFVDIEEADRTLLHFAPI